jgi:lysylphosphatidylglycerol synthetase-like protein (DUF2156 family)
MRSMVWILTLCARRDWYRKVQALTANASHGILFRVGRARVRVEQVTFTLSQHQELEPDVQTGEQNKYLVTQNPRGDHVL